MAPPNPTSPATDATTLRSKRSVGTIMTGVDHLKRYRPPLTGADADGGAAVQNVAGAGGAASAASGGP